MTMVKRRLINVSNRLPVQIRKQASGGIRLTPSPGGLASALDSAWRDRPGIWIGWPGTSQLPQQMDHLLSKASVNRNYTLQGVVLTEQEVSKFYAGFANEIIWPLFHDMPTRCNFDPDYWQIYQQVNRKFAQVTAQSSAGQDFIWAHDYHLMLMASYLRELGSHSRVAFFLHIPFPAPDIFEKLPWREPILRGLLKYDLLGFQTDRDRNNFCNCLRRLLPAVEIQDGPAQVQIAFENARALAGTFPISIDFEAFSSKAARPEIAERAAEIRRDLNDNALVLGVDRMDYTKGIPERLKSFRILLQQFPELRKQVTLVQVVVPSREDIPGYRDLRREVELLVSQINGEFTQPGWVPIHYMHRNLPRNELLGYYRAADVALITPLKDGMNLVAKEFCAAQIDERGVVIISEFAGAGPELSEGAILVNPNDFASVAQAIRRACVMPAVERRDRMRVLRQRVRDHSVQRWVRTFFQAAGVVEASPAGSGEGVGRNGIDNGEASRISPLVAAPAFVSPAASRVVEIKRNWHPGWYAQNKE